jgi:hypothetical protein
MTNSENEKKKVSLKELMEQQLAKKKEKLSNSKHGQNAVGSNQKMKSQQHKKTTNTRRKMGS